MENWCYNDVRFFGDEEALEKLEDILQDMESRCKYESDGVSPDFFVDQPSRFFFDVSLGELNGNIYLAYLTQRSTNEPDLIKIAEQANVNFVYDAAGPGIYQRCRYITGGSLVYAVMLRHEDNMCDFDRDGILPDLV